jgi:hypothetical protein
MTCVSFTIVSQTSLLAEQKYDGKAGQDEPVIRTISPAASFSPIVYSFLGLVSSQIQEITDLGKAGRDRHPHTIDMFDRLDQAMVKPMQPQPSFLCSPGI